MTLDVRTMCLGALSIEEASGYELQKNFKEGAFSHFLEASYGSIYPALTRLTEDGLVTCSEQVQAGRPDKKVYSINDAGRGALADALAGLPAEDKHRSEFLFFMSFSDLMDSRQIERLVDTRVETLRDRLALIDEAEAEAFSKGQEFVLGYGRVILEASIKYLEENRYLVEQAPAGALKTGKPGNGTAAPLTPVPPTNHGQ